MKLNLSKIRAIEKKLEDIKNGKNQNEFKQVPNDFRIFTSLLKIRSGNKIEKFNLYQYQLFLNHLIDLKYSSYCIIKSRQVGCSQFFLGKQLHNAILNAAWVSINFYRNSEDAGAFSRRMRTMVTSLEEYCQAVNDNVGLLKLNNHAEIFFKNSSREGARSYDSVSMMVFEEAAFAERLESIYTASSPATAMTEGESSKILISTPSAKTGFYWNMLSSNNPVGLDVEDVCNEVREGRLKSHDMQGVYHWVDDNGCCKIILHYSCHPKYAKHANYIEYRMQSDNITKETAEREYNLAFINSAINVFSFETVVKSVDEFLELEKEPEKGCEYFLGIDPAFGGQNYCVGIILKETDEGQLLNTHLYRKNNSSTEKYLFDLAELIKKFQPEKICIEKNGGGIVFLNQLSKKFKSLNFVGINTTNEYKEAMAEYIVLAIESDVLKFHSKSVIIQEMLSYVKVNKTMGATNGKNDDTISALFQGLSVSSFVKEQERGLFDLFPES